MPAAAPGATADDVKRGLRGLESGPGAQEFVLGTLDLSNGGYATVDADLRSLAHVHTLEASGNAFADVGFAAQLPALRALSADGCAVAAAPDLGAAPCELLSLADNRLRGLEGLAAPALRQLRLRGNKIASAAGVEGAPLLRELDLRGNRLASSAELAALGELRELDVSGNALAELDGCAALGALTELRAAGNQVAALPERMPASLVRLDLGGNGVPDVAALAPLAKVQALRHLVLADNPVADVDDYRREVLIAVPLLQTLDGEAFSREERREAAVEANERAEALRLALELEEEERLAALALEEEERLAALEEEERLAAVAAEEGQESGEAEDDE